MKILLFGILAVIATPLPGTTHNASPDWLVGCWESPDKKSKEVWVQEPDGSLLGFGASLDEGEIGFYEILRIDQLADGALTYTAYPAGQAPATFTARKTAQGSIVFSNPSHDYPQEISYRRDGNDLFATISALGGENVQSFNKQQCE